MEQRIERVLEYVIADYIQTAEPISSGSVVEAHDLDVSSATIRNWFAVLEEEGFLSQPHASAGRIPSEKAYAWYVERLGNPSPSANERKLVSAALEEGVDLPQQAKRIAKACAEYVGAAMFVGSNGSDAYYTGLTILFGQPEFRDWVRVVSMGSVLDRFDRELAALQERSFVSPTALIGSACPFGSGCASVVLSLGTGAIIAAFGPVRMPYAKARNILAAAGRALSS